jgi:flagellar biosynthesis/type III secretory pathway protein FliH
MAKQKRLHQAESPLVVNDGKQDLITFRFLTLALFKQQAEHYVQEHLVSMYPLLPTMQGADHAIMKRAMDEMADIYRDDEATLAEQFVWMEILLERTTTISQQEKQKIQEQLKMYNSLWEDHPKVKQIRAESRAKGRAEGEAKGLAEGEAEGEIRALQSAVVTIVKARFPALAELAQQKVAQVNNAEVLRFLLAQISPEFDEAVVRALLRPTVI